MFGPFSSCIKIYLHLTCKVLAQDLALNTQLFLFPPTNSMLCHVLTLTSTSFNFYKTSKNQHWEYNSNLPPHCTNSMLCSVPSPPPLFSQDSQELILWIQRGKRTSKRQLNFLRSLSEKGISILSKLMGYLFFSILILKRQVYWRKRKFKGNWNYLLRRINQRWSCKQSESVQRDYHHFGGRIGGDQLLQELTRAGRQDGIMVHVLQDGDQLQLQVYWRG